MNREELTSWLGSELREVGLASSLRNRIDEEFIRTVSSKLAAWLQTGVSVSTSIALDPHLITAVSADEQIVIRICEVDTTLPKEPLGFFEEESDRQAISMIKSEASHPEPIELRLSLGKSERSDG